MGKRTLVALLAILVGYLLLPVLVGNLALSALARTINCTPYAPRCAAGVNDMTAGWSAGEPERFRPWIALVTFTRQLAPFAEALRLRQAELLAASGEYAQAAALIEPLPVPAYAHSDEVETALARSRLYLSGLPENALLAAHQRTATGERDAALQALRVAIATAPELLGAPEWALYRELTGSGAAAFPSPFEHSVEHDLDRSIVWRGLQIDGVRVDSSAFESNGNGDVTLWLRAAVEAPPPGAVDADGGRWWLPYQGQNLAPNPGFRWGEERVHNGTVPAGYFALYRAGGNGITFPEQEGSIALRFNGDGIQSVSSYPLAVDVGALYLMGATVTTAGRFTLGRRCIPLQNFPRHDIWVNALVEADLRVEWEQIQPARTVAHIGPAHPAGQVAACQLVLEARAGETIVDNVFWIRISGE